MQSNYAMICQICKHYDRFGKYGFGETGNNCDAFPDGIPEDILNRENIHQEPLPIQKNNIVFEISEETNKLFGLVPSDFYGGKVPNYKK